MRYEVMDLLGGGTIRVAVPETPEDIEELRRRVDAGEIDDRLSFGDEPDMGKSLADVLEQDS